MKDMKMPQNLNIAHEIDLILAEYKQRLDSGDISKNTYRSANYSFGKIKKFWGHLKPSYITKERWVKFQTKYDERFHENQFNICKFFTILVRVLYEKGLLEKKPQIKNQFARRERDTRRKLKNWLYSDDQIKALESACLDDKERLATRLGHKLAFRISDVVQLTWDRIILEGKVAFIEFGGSDDKAGAIARCPLTQDLVELLLRLPKVSRWVFPQKNNPDQHILTQQFDFNGIKARASIKKGGFHDLRRYRLSLDFKNPRLTASIVCKLRRISMAVALESYIKTNDDDLALLISETK